MAVVGGDEVPRHADLVEGIADGIQDEDGGNQRGKDFVGETAEVVHDAVQIDKGRKGQEGAEPQTGPGVEGQEGNVHVVGHFVDDGLDCQDGTGASVNHHGHTADQSVENAIPGRRGEHLDGTHVIVG